MALALTAHRFGCRPSAMLGVADEVLALDFDAVCSYRLLLQDIERAKAEADALRGDGEENGYIAGKITKDTVFL